MCLYIISTDNNSTCMLQKWRSSFFILFHQISVFIIVFSSKVQNSIKKHTQSIGMFCSFISLSHPFLSISLSLVLLPLSFLPTFIIPLLPLFFSLSLSPFLSHTFEATLPLSHTHTLTTYLPTYPLLSSNSSIMSNTFFSISLLILHSTYFFSFFPLSFSSLPLLLSLLPLSPLFSPSSSPPPHLSLSLLGSTFNLPQNF